MQRSESLVSNDDWGHLKFEVLNGRVGGLDLHPPNFNSYNVDLISIRCGCANLNQIHHDFCFYM